ncbi:MAG TPA: PfkB family carbohydrate kinase [Actinomycetota bacterium]|nr:PfkB family carbohydrate kinase [Actinomycetota bacterium]
MHPAVVGHVEWIEFLHVAHVPTPGEIVHADDRWETVGGGGAIAAVQLARLAGSSVLFAALGDDELGHRARDDLTALGVRVECTFRPEPQRRCFVYIDDDGERTITVLGDRMGANGSDPLAWDDLTGVDGLYFTAGDDEALRRARAADAIVATSRVFDQLVRARVPIDAVVGSARDEAERFVAGRMDPEPTLVVMTEGGRGGSWERPGEQRHHFDPAPPPGPKVDAYGCGDSFAGGLAYGLGAGMDAAAAVDLAARCGAACLTGRGPYEGQLRTVR